MPFLYNKSLFDLPKIQFGKILNKGVWRLRNSLGWGLQLRTGAVLPPTAPECHCHWSGSNSTGSAFWETPAHFRQWRLKVSFGTSLLVEFLSLEMLVFVLFYRAWYGFKARRLWRLFIFPWICLSFFLWEVYIIFIKIFDLTAATDANISTVRSNISHEREIETCKSCKLVQIAIGKHYFFPQMFAGFVSIYMQKLIVIKPYTL